MKSPHNAFISRNINIDGCLDEGCFWTIYQNSLHKHPSAKHPSVVVYGLGTLGNTDTHYMVALQYGELNPTSMTLAFREEHAR
jgi:hypothetical protein